MYFDFRKIKTNNSYSTEEINRDKEFTKQMLANWFSQNIDEMTERYYEIEDIGVVERIGNFIKLIKEAELSFAIGAYQSTIALISISAEDLTRFFATMSGINTDNQTQNDRINNLHSSSLISDTIKNRLHTIRRLRNDCLHYNSSFSSRPVNDLKIDAKNILNEVKKLYAELVGSTDISEIDTQKLIDIVDAITHSAASNETHGVMNLDDALIRTRNVFQEAFGINLSINLGNEVVQRLSLYKVDEIDLDMTPPETTLIDQVRGMPVVVDLDEEQIRHLEETGISEEDMVFAKLTSTTNSLGTTGSWTFLTKPIKL